MRSRLGLFVLALTLTVGLPAAHAQDAPTEKVPAELLGEFTFIGDGVVTFYLEGDLILGQVTTVPASDGIRLIGGADISPCGFEDGREFPFVLDEFGVGEWFFFDIDNAGECVRFEGSPVTVSFTGIGATATGQIPEGHRDFTEVPNSHTMLRIGNVTNFPTTTAGTTTTSTTTTTTVGFTEEEAREILGENEPRSFAEWFEDIAPFIGAAIALGVVLYVLLWRKGWRLPWYAEEIEPFPEPPEREEPDPTCTCTAEITIEGAHTILTCCSHTLQGDLHDCCDTNGVKDPLRTHLDLNEKYGDKRDFFDLIYKATITPGECDGGGRLRLEDLTSRWYFDDNGEAGFGITIEVSIPVDCPHGPQKPLQLYAHRKITRQKGKCMIGVMVKQVDTLDVSHIETHIICGNYSETFGYFPKGAREFLRTLTGVPGMVGHMRENSPRVHPSGMTIDVVQRLADNYRGSPEHRVHDWDIWWFIFDDCGKCDRLRDYWEKLRAWPGDYYLTGKNCASTAAEGLKEVGILPSTFITATTVTPSELETSLQRNYEESSKQEIRRGN